MTDVVDNTITADDMVDTKVIDAKIDVKVDAPVDVKTDAKPDDKQVDKPAEVKPDWPDDWREKAAGGDEKKLKRLGTYASPQALADALIEAQNRISKGDLKSALPKNPTQEQLTAWREANGIPETSDKYDIKELKLDDTDKNLIAKYLNAAHGTNQTPEQVKASLSAYKEAREIAATERQNQDLQIKTDAEDTLRGEWGNDYRRNISLISGLMDSAPQGIKDRLFSGRLYDGTPIGSDPDILRFLVGIALERNPTGTVVPNSGANMMQSVDEEIAKIEKTMRENRSEYNRNEKMQERYRNLLDYQQTRKAA